MVIIKENGMIIISSKQGRLVGAQIHSLAHSYRRQRSANSCIQAVHYIAGSAVHTQMRAEVIQSVTYI